MCEEVPTPHLTRGESVPADENCALLMRSFGWPEWPERLRDAWLIRCGGLHVADRVCYISGVGTVKAEWRGVTYARNLFKYHSNAVFAVVERVFEKSKVSSSTRVLSSQLGAS
jgi:hypothetical protein